MKPAPVPHNEEARVQSLKAHKLLDTLPEDVYDDITQIAAEICGTPIASLTLVDENRLWFKSKQGIDISEIPREQSFCAHTIMNPDDILVIENARYNERFFDNPVVAGTPGIAFYAGVPVKGADGFAFGSICVMDNRPRDLSEQKLESLKALAKLVNAHFELRGLKIQMAERQNSFQRVQTLVHDMQGEVAQLKTNNLDPEQILHLQNLQQALTLLECVK